MIDAALLPHLIPSLAQIFVWAAVFAIAAGFTVLGAALGGKSRDPVFDLPVGWAAAALLFTILGTLTDLSFTKVFLILLVLTLGAGYRLIRSGDNPFTAETGRFLLLLAPMMLVLLSMLPSQWDEFAQWLPNARYLVENDGFPRAGRPPSDSVFPAYPYALPLIAYLASRATGLFAEAAPAIFNVLMLAVFARMALSLVWEGKERPSWTLLVWLTLAATVLGPTFVPKLILTTYADAPTALALAAAVLAGWRLLEDLGRRPRPGLLVQFALLTTLLLLLKQANFVLYVMAALGLGALALRHPEAPRGKSFLWLAVGLAPAFAAFLLWRHYSGIHMPGGDMRVPPVSDWLFHLAGAIAGRMLFVASQKGVYFSLALILTGIGIWGFLKPATPFRRFALVGAAIFLGYNLFLYFVYVAVYGEYEGRNAASYWRYNTHIGLVVTLGVMMTLKELWPNRIAPHLAGARLKAAGWLALGAAVLLPVLLAPKIRFDAHPVKVYAREVAREMKPLLPKGAQIAGLDLRGTGFYPMFLDYLLGTGIDVPQRVNVFTRNEAADIKARLDKPEITHAWVHTQAPGLAEALGFALAADASHLLEKKDGAWRLVKSWPFPGYDDPTKIPD